MFYFGRNQISPSLQAKHTDFETTSDEITASLPLCFLKYSSRQSAYFTAAVCQESRITVYVHVVSWQLSKL